jgi:hypothetical protein
MFAALLPRTTAKTGRMAGYPADSWATLAGRHNRRKEPRSTCKTLTAARLHSSPQDESYWAVNITLVEVVTAPLFPLAAAVAS